jgi:SAM-dependent methyltransferase
LNLRIHDAAPDIVVFDNVNKERPLIVVEAKRELPREVDLLNPAVQQAFRYAAALGPFVRYLLVSDGSQNHWFRLKEEGASLDYAQAPRASTIAESADATSELSQNVLHFALETVLLILLREKVRIDMRTARDLLRILVFKQAEGDDTEMFRYLSPPEILDRVTFEVSERLGVSSLGEWALPIHVVHEVFFTLFSVKLNSVPKASLARVFWREIAPSLIEPDQVWCSPSALAELLVSLAGPEPGYRIIDPACGTGQFLVEAAYAKPTIIEPLHVVGREADPIAMEVARLNMLLGGLDPHLISDARETTLAESIRKSGGSFDIAICDPPIGIKGNLDLDPIIESSIAGKIETAFVAASISLLRDGGRGVFLLPEGVFFAHDRRNFRSWLLDNVRIDAIISLPPGAWTAARSQTQASILVFTKARQQRLAEYPVFVADLKSRPSRGVNESEIPLESRFRKVADEFRRSRKTAVLGAFEVSRRVSSRLLSAERIDVSGILLESWRTSPGSVQSDYEIRKLKDVVEVVSGRFLKTSSSALRAGNYIQAGNVKRFSIDIGGTPPLVYEQLNLPHSSFLQPDDVLITSTGQYIGRSALVRAEHLPAVASNAVTILRINDKSVIDPEYLVAFLNSPAGVEQFEQRKIKGVAQPYIRKGDVGEVSIVLPPLPVQHAVVAKIGNLLERADALASESELMRSRAHHLLLEVLKAGGNR